MAESILVIDNRDSFTWNLVQYLRELGAEVAVRRSDAITPEEVRAGSHDGILISPGPGRPEASEISRAVVKALGGRVPILGVCLGHQVIALDAGCRIEQAAVPVHGKTSRISHDGRSLFRGIPSPFEATRYHSLIVARESVGAGLEITATSEDGLVMGLRRARPGEGALLEGVQFHPESILSEHGMAILGNFLREVRERSVGTPRR